MVEEKLKEMGIQVPAAAKPLAAYVPAVKTDGYVYTSGQIPLVDGKLCCTGKVGKDVALEDAYAAAKICAINCLAAIKTVVGSLDEIKQVVKVVGFVNSAPGFSAQPKVVNGASEFLGEVFGDAGRHARSAVGVSELPIDSPVEIELIVKLK